MFGHDKSKHNDETYLSQTISMTQSESSPRTSPRAVDYHSHPSNQQHKSRSPPPPPLAEPSYRRDQLAAAHQQEALLLDEDDEDLIRAVEGVTVTHEEGDPYGAPPPSYEAVVGGALGYEE